MSSSRIPFLIVICGSTASGKSSLAVALAQRLHGSIILADSRQVYRDFSIGTAKPSLLEQNTVPHHLVDLCDPTWTLTLAEYQRHAQDAIAQCFEQDTVSLLVGGTGLYIKSIVRGLKIPQVPPQPDLRAQLTRLGQSVCYPMLQTFDPAAAAKIHPNDPTRTQRALEVLYATGQTISSQQGENPPPYPILQIGLDSPKIDDRIRRRTHDMIDQGFVAEVKLLIATYGEDLPLLNTLGYAEIRQYLRGDVDLDAAIEQIILHTRQFAKRQRTWFRADPSIVWHDSDAPDLVETVFDRVAAFIRVHLRK